MSVLRSCVCVVLLTHIVIRIRTARKKVMQVDNMKRNGEGYYDPTAYDGTKKVIREETRLENDTERLMLNLQRMAEGLGYEVLELTLRHRKTGKVFK